MKVGAGELCIIQAEDPCCDFGGFFASGEGRKHRRMLEEALRSAIPHMRNRELTDTILLGSGMRGTHLRCPPLLHRPARSDAGVALWQHGSASLQPLQPQL